VVSNKVTTAGQIFAAQTVANIALVEVISEVLLV
jgi:hypothetical protein